jgi:RNA-binding protein
MKRAGTVTGTAQGVVVVHSDDDEAPDLGTTVIDESLDDVGTVVDVFGPVERPYLAVASERDTVATLVGTPVYSREN